MRRVLVEPSKRDCRHGEGELRQFKGVDDELRKIHCGAKEASAQSFLFGKVAKGLAVEQRVGGGIDETKEIVVTGLCLTVFRPKRGAAEVGTESEHYGCACHHGLVEMSWRKFFFHLLAACHYDTVELEIAHCRRALGILQQACQ